MQQSKRKRSKLDLIIVGYFMISLFGFFFSVKIIPKMLTIVYKAIIITSSIMFGVSLFISSALFYIIVIRGEG